MPVFFAKELLKKSRPDCKITPPLSPPKSRIRMFPVFRKKNRNGWFRKTPIKKAKPGCKKDFIV